MKLYTKYLSWKIKSLNITYARNTVIIITNFNNKQKFQDHVLVLKMLVNSPQ